MEGGSKAGFPEINDIRSESEFRGITFSKYKLSDVTKALLKSLANFLELNPLATGRQNSFVPENSSSFGKRC